MHRELNELHDPLLAAGMTHESLDHGKPGAKLRTKSKAVEPTDDIDNLQFLSLVCGFLSLVCGFARFKN